MDWWNGEQVTLEVLIKCVTNKNINEKETAQFVPKKKKGIK